MEKMSETYFVLYMPVYHRGHQQLLARYPEVKKIVLLGQEELEEWGPVHKDIHSLELESMQRILTGEGWQVLTAAQLAAEATGKIKLIVAQDEVVEAWIGKNYPDAEVIRDSARLRWTKKNSLAEQKLEQMVTAEEIPAWVAAALARARTEGDKSSDWWRQVGAVLRLADGAELVAHNAHLPEPETPNINGDVRAQWHKGEHFELTTAIHAEAAVIAAAAKAGRGVRGAELVVTDFPCPVCARLIVAAGVKVVYYHRGYAMLDGEEILRVGGVSVRQV
jgi:dCMP deaminase